MSHLLGGLIGRQQQQFITIGQHSATRRPQFIVQMLSFWKPLNISLHLADFRP
jgi:hypothetical protein